MPALYQSMTHSESNIENTTADIFKVKLERPMVEDLSKNIRNNFGITIVQYLQI